MRKIIVATILDRGLRLAWPPYAAALHHVLLDVDRPEDYAALCTG